MIWQFIDSSSVGGAERHIATVSASLVRYGADVTVVLYQKHGDNPWLQQLAAENLKSRVLAGGFGDLMQALKAQRPALVHTHGYKAGILGRIAARLNRIPVVSTYHSGERGPFPVGLYDFADDWSGILAERIAVSPAIQQRLPLSSRLIPSYVTAPPTPPTSQLPQRIAFIGRLSQEKAPDLFCAIARLRPDAGEWHVYGDGPMRAALEAEYGNIVRFHGVVTDLSSVWPTLGLVLMPSRFEGIPLVALEAGAHGVPVLAARVGGLSAIIDHGDTGWLFDAESVDQAGRLLGEWERLLNGHEQETFRRRCWQNVQDRYSERRWLPEILAVYRKAGWRGASSEFRS